MGRIWRLGDHLSTALIVTTLIQVNVDMANLSCWQTSQIHHTMWCRYNEVNFQTNIYKKHPIAHPSGRGMGVFCGSNLWSIYCLSSSYYLCIISLHWNAFWLQRHSTVHGFRQRLLLQQLENSIARLANLGQNVTLTAIQLKWLLMYILELGMSKFQQVVKRLLSYEGIK